MKRIVFCMLSFALVGFVAAPLNAAELKVGDRAPDFKLPGSDGKTYSLKDFAGKKAVVIAWFPKAFTGGCTAECKSMKEDGEAIRKFDAAYFTASVDTPAENKKFAEHVEDGERTFLPGHVRRRAQEGRGGGLMARSAGPGGGRERFRVQRDEFVVVQCRDLGALLAVQPGDVRREQGYGLGFARRAAT